MNTASAAATDSAITSRAGLPLTAPILAGCGPERRSHCAALMFRGADLAAGDPVAVVVAERTGRVLRQRVAVTLAVGGPHEVRDDVEVPVGDLARLPPEVGQAQVDIELQQVDSRRVIGHGDEGTEAVGRHLEAVVDRPLRPL